MNLIIHDLDREEWKKLSGEYAGWNVVTDNGAMHPCIGCFSCWKRTPGICAIKDGYENMGSLIHEADEIVVISRYTYGGFSGSVKNVFDRCLGYVLPHFEVIGNETHHMKRYDEDKPFTFIFHGPELTEDEKASAERYVRAVCNNIRGHVKSVGFRTDEKNEAGEVPGKPVEGAEAAGAKTSAKNARTAAPEDEKQASAAKSSPREPGSMIILNGSMRNTSGNSAKFARVLKDRLRSKSGKAEIIDLRDHMDDMEPLAAKLASADRLILCAPLYVDGLPSQVIRLMELMESHRSAPGKTYVLANMGLYESSQLVSLYEAVKQWCGRCGSEYCGGLGISAGELLGALMKAMPFGWGATKKASICMTILAEAIIRGQVTRDLYAEPHMFPRSLYIRIANSGWDRGARQNGLSPEDLYRIPGPPEASADISKAAAAKPAEPAGTSKREPEAAYLEGIRPVTMEHAARYGEIYAAAFSGEPWNDPWKKEDAEIHVRELLESKQSYGLEYVLDGQVAGFILGTSMLFHYGRTFEINDLAVDPAFRGRGIAKTLLERCLEEMKKRGMAGVNLITGAEGFLPEFYEKYGFTREDRVILMGKELL